MEHNVQVPRVKSIDNTLNVLKEGYNFIQNRRKQLNSDIFEARVLGETALCMGGMEAAKLFYDNDRFQRKGAAPMRVQKTLFGVNAIQTMDGNAHEHRKLLFMSLMAPDRLQVLSNLLWDRWRDYAARWEQMDSIVLFDEVQEMLCRAACQWAGVLLPEREVKQRAKDFGAMVDAFGAVGPRHWQGRKARQNGEMWIRTVIEQVRSGSMKADKYTALHAMAFHRDQEGKPLDTQMAAVELINVLRPIVAIATYVTFGALAIHDYPECKKQLLVGGEKEQEMFVQEVRRFYPFGPFLGARVKKDFTWNSYDFKEGQLVLLDVYGTNHDRKLWDLPDKFWPHRFSNWEGSLFDLIPQGGGDPYKGHRCPGESVTILVLKSSFEFMTKHMDYEVAPNQDLSYSLRRMPTLPNSKFIIQNVSLRK
ncbi:cytochrome P450 [Peribacillus sp. SCS-155]|uniref:cytochrome P450 n=1 Tax=Peribacillus sedimenti TaxID=3115297 RepID=UPI003906BB8B